MHGASRAHCSKVISDKVIRSLPAYNNAVTVSTQIMRSKRTTCLHSQYRSRASERKTTRIVGEHVARAYLVPAFQPPPPPHSQNRDALLCFRGRSRLRHLFSFTDTALSIHCLTIDKISGGVAFSEVTSSEWGLRNVLGFIDSVYLRSSRQTA